MKLRTLIVSDRESEYIWDYFDKKAFAGVEIVISCGDLSSKYLSFLVTMLNVPLLYVRGNHDAGYERNPPEGCIDLERGPVTIKGVRFVGFGGCRSNQKHINYYTEQAMTRRVKRTMLFQGAKPCNVLVTHAPAAGLGDGEDSFHQGFSCFRDFLTRYQPSYHFHGHQHLAYQPGGQRILQCGPTTIVNGYHYHMMDLEFAAIGGSEDYE